MKTLAIGKVVSAFVDGEDVIIKTALNGANAQVVSALLKAVTGWEVKITNEEDENVGVEVHG